MMMENLTTIAYAHACYCLSFEEAAVQRIPNAQGRAQAGILAIAKAQ